FKEIDEFDPFKVKVARIQGVVNLPMIPRGSSLLGNTSFNVNGWYKGKQIQFFDLGLFEKTKANVIVLPALQEVDIMDENFNTLEMVFVNETILHSPSTFYLRYSVQGLSYLPTSYSDIASYDNISLLFDSFFFNYPPAPPPAPIVTETATTSIDVITSVPVEETSKISSRTERPEQTSELVATSKILLTSEISLTVGSKSVYTSATFAATTAALTSQAERTTSVEPKETKETSTNEFLSSSIDHLEQMSRTEAVTKNFPASESAATFESKRFYESASSIEIESSRADTDKTHTLTTETETEFYSESQLFSKTKSYQTAYTTVAVSTNYSLTNISKQSRATATSPSFSNEVTTTFNNHQTLLSGEIKSATATNTLEKTNFISKSQTGGVYYVTSWIPDRVNPSSPTATKTHEIYYLTEWQHTPKKTSAVTEVPTASFNNLTNAHNTAPGHEIYNITVWAPDTPSPANPTATTGSHEVYYATKWEADTSIATTTFYDHASQVSTKIPVETHEVYNVTIWAPDQTSTANPTSTTGFHEVYYVTKWELDSTKTTQVVPTATINSNVNALNATRGAPVATHEVYNITVWAPDTSSAPPLTATAGSHEVYNISVWAPDSSTEPFHENANTVKTQAHETYHVTKWEPDVPSTHEVYNITVWAPDTPNESVTATVSYHGNLNSTEVSSYTRGVATVPTVTHEVYLVSTRIRRPNAKTRITKSV
ncbi:hypothetical protein HK100_011856, partial [Physocladia obscura]